MSDGSIYAQTDPIVDALKRARTAEARERAFCDAATEFDRRLAAVRAECEPIAAVTARYQWTHAEDCHLSHPECLAARVLRILNGEGT